MNVLRHGVLAALGWPLLAVAEPAAAAPPPDGADWFGLLAPVVAVTALMLALLWWLRRGKTLRGKGNGPLRVVQAVAVGSRERVVVLDAQGRRLLLGVTANRVELIAELRAPGVTDTDDSR